MCTNQALKCLFVNSAKLNESIGSSSEYGSDYKNRNQIKIYFNRRLKVLTGIEEKTTFRDLITAILVSSSKALPNDKLVKEIDRYVICETLNSVEKCLDSELNVREELERIRSERTLLNHDQNISHTMRLKSSIKCLPMKINSNLNELRSDSNTVLVLEEFIGEQYNRPKTHKSDKSLKKALIRFDRHIEERKRYIRLLEDYLSMLESLERFDRNEGQLIVYDSDSTNDTGFNSVSTSLESLFFNSNHCFSTYV